MICQRCGSRLERGYRIDDDDVGHGQEWKCPSCGAAGCVLDNGRRIGTAVNPDATSRPGASASSGTVAIADGGERHA